MIKSAESLMFEIQFHPADIWKPVRYFFLSRAGARWLAVAAGLIVIMVITGLALAPLSIQGLLLTSEQSRLRHLNQLHLEVLAQRETSMEALEKRLEHLRSRQRQISLVLGTDRIDTAGDRAEESAPFNVNHHDAHKALQRGIVLSSESAALLVLADQLTAFAQEHQTLVHTVPSICPIAAGEFVLTSPFGERISPFTNTRDFHAGLDLAAREGTPVMATGDGRVIFAGRFPLRRNARWWRFGNAVVIRHGDNFLTIYAHLHEISVKRGHNVKRGQTIGTVGNSGWSTSPHLHYEVRAFRDGQRDPIPVDPRIHILDHQWKGHEQMLISGRYAPQSNFDPLPSRLR
jgi:murein DD-endopeptidase MepM/ murein hydrolase activator NlpD